MSVVDEINPWHIVLKTNFSTNESNFTGFLFSYYHKSNLARSKMGDFGRISSNLGEFRPMLIWEKFAQIGR
jgi:hypothetical protein